MYLLMSTKHKSSELSQVEGYYHDFYSTTFLRMLQTLKNCHFVANSSMERK